MRMVWREHLRERASSPGDPERWRAARDCQEAEVARVGCGGIGGRDPSIDPKGSPSLYQHINNSCLKRKITT
jgi:hypothetical protein